MKERDVWGMIGSFGMMDVIVGYDQPWLDGGPDVAGGGMPDIWIWV